MKKNDPLPYLIQLLNYLESTGVLYEIYRTGWFSQRAQLCRAVYLTVHAEVCAGNSITVSVQYAAEVCRVSQTTVWECLKEVREFKPNGKTKLMPNFIFKYVTSVEIKKKIEKKKRR